MNITTNKLNIPVYHNTQTFVKNSIGSIKHYPYKLYMRYIKVECYGFYLKYQYNEK
jgi:hypothetical protein